MKLGVVFPQLEIGNDPVAIRDYVQAAEGAGFERLVVFDHVLGIEPEAHRATWRGARPVDSSYTYQSAFHEPFVLFGYLAHVTERIDFFTGVLILPQRQTALVAKQAAQVALLSGDRLVLGVGVGWNPEEYDALGQDFSKRGRRIEEQIELMRRLWAEPTLTFEGEFDRVTDAGINPRPDRAVPIWMGGNAPAVLERAGRIADGWHIPRIFRGDPSTIAEPFAQVQAAAEAAGRDPSTLGLGSVLHSCEFDEDGQLALVRGAEEVGVTHLSFNTMECGYTSPQQHIDAIVDFARRAGVSAAT